MAATKTFHVDDVVALKNGETMDAVGFVDRTHGEVESHEPLPGGAYGMKIHRSKSLSRAAYKQFMRDGVPPKGFALVQWQTHPKTELVAEKELELLDRTFLAGDIIRRDDDSNTLAGTITSVRRRCTLLGMCEAKELKSGKSLRAAWLPSPIDDEPPLLELVKEGPVLHDIPADELQFVHQYNEGNLVIYKSWLGRIRECFDEITVRLSDNGVVTLKDEMDLEALNGDPEERLSIGSLVKTKKGALRTGLWRFGAYNPNTVPVGVVVDVRTQECQVDWLQASPGSGFREGWLDGPVNPIPEAIITQDELESGNFQIYDLTRRPSDSDRSSTKTRSDLELQGGLRVRFKDVAGASVKYDGSTSHGKLERLDRRDTMGYDMNVFTVMNTRTEVEVLWNDLSITTEASISLIPDFATDDEDAVFPGEIVCTNEQKADGPDGTIKPAKIGVVQQVNTSDRIAQVRWCVNHTLSFLETTMTTPLPGTSLGDLQEGSEEVSFYDIKAPESVNRRRGDFVLLPDISGLDFTSESIHWVGEVVDVTPNGQAVIRLGASDPVREITRPMELTILAFKASDLDDMGDEHSEMDEEDGMSFSDELDDLDEDLEMEDDDGQWWVAGQPGLLVDEDDDSWSTASEDEDDHAAEPMDTDVEDPTASVPELTDGVPVTPAAPQLPDPPASTTAAKPSITIEEMNLSSFPDAPLPYDIVETPVPVNHPFAHRTAASSSTHMKAVQKEHKILRTASALPSGIYVRTWESRLDLIRVLFIGPVGTPYEYAPFVVDLFLGPTFPTEPPTAHFHSWTSEGTGMQGRVNPNLYEDGKICLSLLGTWQGDDAKGEGWTAGKSTVLQLLVSILGLVLVKEPYYSKSLQQFLDRV